MSSVPSGGPSSGPSDDQAGGSLFGPGPFEKDLHETPTVLWAAVVLMCLGVALVGGGVVALSRSVPIAVVLLVAGAVVGVVGLVLGLTHGIMTNVE